MMRMDRSADDACRHCGGHVTERFRAVSGDVDDVAHRCLGCDCFRRVSRGSAAGNETGLPDSDDHPNRNRGQRVGAIVRTDGDEFSGD
ncbi:hypothetical protein [Halorubrum sp. Boch-26]|uniref:DUF7563 family protein n=1 Tax=Halorubrum sp. Boch-26 TaxID=2994426 RepID=UPI0024695C0A|nr:hypothetical protein [Halorubrum sp. Boch-26]